MCNFIVPKPFTARPRAIGSSAIGLALALVFSATQANTQHLDPPLGWDIWDPTGSSREIWEGEQESERVRWRIERHQAYITDGVPDAYQGASNPLPRIPSVLETGRHLYARNCASCHDEGGTGRGKAGLSLYPPPALLVHLVRLPTRVDEYLLWSIAEGGERFSSEMPALKTHSRGSRSGGLSRICGQAFPTQAATSKISRADSL